MELSGFEFAYGIPGTMGGAVYMNAGAYDSEMKNVLHCMPGKCMKKKNSIVEKTLIIAGAVLLIQASLSMGFFRQEYWSELPFPFLGNLP